MPCTVLISLADDQTLPNGTASDLQGGAREDQHGDTLLGVYALLQLYFLRSISKHIIFV